MGWVCVNDARGQSHHVWCRRNTVLTLWMTAVRRWRICKERRHVCSRRPWRRKWGAIVRLVRIRHDVRRWVRLLLGRRCLGLLAHRGGVGRAARGGGVFVVLLAAWALVADAGNIAEDMLDDEQAVWAGLGWSRKIAHSDSRFRAQTQMSARGYCPFPDLFLDDSGSSVAGFLLSCGCRAL